MFLFLNSCHFCTQKHLLLLHAERYNLCVTLIAIKFIQMYCIERHFNKFQEMRSFVNFLPVLISITYANSEYIARQSNLKVRELSYGNKWERRQAKFLLSNHN